ncbi:MAG: DUF1573 domain-containing protein [Desulfobacterales bacterium]|nr:DUF1573 domain-containing protein [Desulfobacterales bacterium]
MIRRKIPLAVCLAALMALLGAIAALAGSDAAGEPRTVVKHPKHDFGSVYAGTDITHTFNIENAGDTPLHLKSVRSG